MTCHDCPNDATDGYTWRGKRRCVECHERRILNRQPPVKFLFRGATKYKVRSTPPPEPSFVVTSPRPKDPLLSKGHGIVNADRLRQEDIRLAARALREGWNPPPLVMKRLVAVAGNTKRKNRDKADAAAVAACRVVLDEVARRT